MYGLRGIRNFLWGQAQPTNGDVNTENENDLDDTDWSEFNDLDDEYSTEIENVAQRSRRSLKCIKYTRIVFLSIVWLIFTTLLFLTHEKLEKFFSMVVPETGDDFIPSEQPDGLLTLILKGPFLHGPSDFMEDRNQMNKGHLIITVKRLSTSGNTRSTDDNWMRMGHMSVNQIWALDLPNQTNFDMTDIHFRSNIFQLEGGDGEVQIKFQTVNTEDSFPVLVMTLPHATTTITGVIFGTLIIAFMYILLFWDVLSRAFIVILACTSSIAAMGWYYIRLPLEDILSIINSDVILEIFGTNIIVTIITTCGLFNFLALQAYRMSRGQLWPILTILAVFTGFGAALLDSIIMLMLMTPVTLRLCEMMQIESASFMTCLILFTNLAYAVLPAGQPTKMVLHHRLLEDKDFISFGSYVAHMVTPVICCLAQTYLHLRLQFPQTQSMLLKNGPEVERLQHSIRLWQHLANSTAGYNTPQVRDNLKGKVRVLRKQLRRLVRRPLPQPDFQENYEYYKGKYPIRNRTLMGKCLVALSIILFLLFTDHFHNIHHLSSGWSVLMSAVMLMCVIELKNLDGLLTTMDWSTLLLVISLFIISKCLVITGVFDSFSIWVEGLVMLAPEEYRLSVAITVTVWISALGSSLVNNIPVAEIVLQSALHMGEVHEMPLQPLMLAVILGCMAGGNGSMIGSISNLTCSGSVMKHGYLYYFWDYFKIGFPVMLGNAFISNCYLLLTHSIFHWH